MRAQHDGLLVWVGSSSSRGGTPPYLAPYFAAKAAADALAVSYALEVARFGIETTIVIPGPFARGTELFANSLAPADAERAGEYDEQYPDMLMEVGRKLAEATPEWADATDVAREIARVITIPKGNRPFRIHIDPVDDGAEVVNLVADRIRTEFLRRLDLDDLLKPS